MTKKIGVAILAAGEGKRLGLPVPKPLATALGRPLIDYTISAVASFGQQQQVTLLVGVVVGHQKELLTTHLQDHCSARGSVMISLAEQTQQLGTADALKAYFGACPWASTMDYTLVMCADTPLISGVELGIMYQAMERDDLEAVVATFHTPNPHGYGRIVRQRPGLKIVEEKDADDIIKQIQEVNSGLYLLRTSFVLQHLFQIENQNRSGEFYLTDLFAPHYQVRPILFAQGEKFQGVNDLTQLEAITHLLRREKNLQLLAQGVRILDLASTYIDWQVTVGAGTIIYPHCYLEGNCVIGKNVVLYPGQMITNTSIADQAIILPYCHLEDSQIAAKAQIGPFAHLRPQSEIGPGAKIGNFVEIKKSQLGPRAKVSHLSYVGDASIGADTNIGCGFITCNYDGVKKHRTTIGEGSFIGSDSQVVAPVEIGNGCYVASGSTITENMPDGSFAIARSRQVTKEKLAQRFLPRKKGE